MPSGIRNPNLTFIYPLEDGSEWAFRREQTANDRDTISNMTRKSIMGPVDRRKVKELLRTGGSVEEYLEELTTNEVVMSAEKATLAIMGVSCQGEFFTVPEGYTDEDGKLSPYAGKLIPQPPKRSLARTDPKQYDAQLALHIEWLGVIDPDERSAALSFATAVWAGASPDDVKRFQAKGVGVDKPERRPGGKG
ncbi:MAG: hypothetical protein LC754_10345 [Acidobacteria bacterium]|nr:hypothetical protein [Acidobacteriota bacterium]